MWNIRSPPFTNSITKKRRSCSGAERRKTTFPHDHPKGNNLTETPALLNGPGTHNCGHVEMAPRMILWFLINFTCLFNGFWCSWTATVKSQRRKRNTDQTHKSFLLSHHRLWSICDVENESPEGCKKICRRQICFVKWSLYTTTADSAKLPCGFVVHCLPQDCSYIIKKYAAQAEQAVSCVRS